MRKPIERTVKPWKACLVHDYHLVHNVTHDGHTHSYWQCGKCPVGTMTHNMQEPSNILDRGEVKVPDVIKREVQVRPPSPVTCR